MGLLDEFLLGAAGGMTSVADSMDRRTQLEEERKRREAELAAQREIRERERREDKEWQDRRDGIYRRTAEEQLAGRTGSRSGSTGGGGSANFEDAALYNTAAELGISYEQAKGMRDGKNPFRKEEMVPGWLEENGGQPLAVPDEDAFRKGMKTLNSNMGRALMGNAADDYSKSKQTDTMTGYGATTFRDVGAKTGDATAAAASAALVTSGKPLYDDGQSGVLQQGSGKVTPTARSQAATNEDNAQAEKTRRENDEGKRNAERGRIEARILEARKAFETSFGKRDRESTPEEWRKRVDAAFENDPIYKRLKAELDKLNGTSSGAPRLVYDPKTGRVG